MSILTIQTFQTSDGSKFESYQDALDHEQRWEILFNIDGSDENHAVLNSLVAVEKYHSTADIKISILALVKYAVTVAYDAGYQLGRDA